MNEEEIELELKKFNWGAFGFSVFWGIGNKVYISLLCLIPVFNLVWMFICGIKGNRWAWENGDYESIEEFKKVQQSWKVPGIIYTILKGLMFLFYTSMFLLFFTIGIFSGIREEMTFNQYNLENEYFEDDYLYEIGEISDIEGWTAATYDLIKLAELSKEKEIYSNGSDYSELVKEVGLPSSTYRSENKMTAHWYSNFSDGSITIEYDIPTNQIIYKDFY